MSFFQTPVHFAHMFWDAWLKIGAIVIDATCGHGNDTLFLAQRILDGTQGKLIAIDIQQEAIESARAKLKAALDPKVFAQVEFYQGCHSLIDQWSTLTADLIVYNLGYLPQTDKQITTQSQTTLKSLNKSLELLKPRGILSITCYPGHSNGRLEAQQVSLWAKELEPNYICCEQKWINRSDKAPFILWIEKRESL